MNMPIKTMERKERAAESQSARSRATLALVPGRKVARELNKGDMLAVPLCILWGACLWLSMYGPWAVFGVESNPGAEGWLSFLWTLPVAAARHLFGR